MQTISDRPAVSAPVGADLPPVLAGAALAVSAAGAALAFAGLDSPLRAPLALFYLVAAPAEAAVFALRRLEPLARMVASLSGAVLIDVLTAESMTVCTFGRLATASQPWACRPSPIPGGDGGESLRTRP